MENPVFTLLITSLAETRVPDAPGALAGGDRLRSCPGFLSLSVDFSFPLVLSGSPFGIPSPAPAEPALGLTRVSASPGVCLQPSLQVLCLALVGAVAGRHKLCHSYTL